MANPLVSVILPCRNEEKSLLGCINSINKVFVDFGIEGEIIVSDSSTDGSPAIARAAGAVLVKHNKEGYGIACLEGFKIAEGKYLFLADPDSTYDFSEIPAFISQLQNGYDFVIGNRFAGKIESGAMPWSHRYFGRYIFKILISIFFKSKIEDIHCGMRALAKDAFSRLRLRTTGMEFASEMIIKSLKQNLKIKELPINYFRRQGATKLKTMTDGWRHLRFILLYSPMVLFFWPGLFLFLFGILIFALAAFDLLKISNIQFQYHPVFLASLLVILGYQLIFFALFAKTYAFTHLGETSGFLSFIHKHITIEKAGLFGLFIVLVGGFLYVSIFYKWVNSGFGELQEVKRSMAALTFAIIGFQTIFSAFMLSILGIKER
jgi:glycosyltransferase involved in cell wall biosynthesis